MSLIVHLMKKDVAYLRYEVAVWLLLVLAQAGLVLYGVDARVPERALKTIGNAYWTLRWVLPVVIGGIFVAQLVQCDPLTGTTAFWRTRPISRATLLVTKLTLAVLLLLIVPFLVEVATYLALGMNASDSLGAAWGAMMVRTVLLAPALAIAVVTPDVARFVVSLIILLVGMALAQWTMLRFMREVLAVGPEWYSTALGGSRFLVFYALVVISGLAVVIHQYLSLRTIRSIVLIPVGLIVCVVAMHTWWYDFFDRPEPAVDRARFDPDSVTLSLDPSPVDPLRYPSAISGSVDHQRMYGFLVVSGASKSRAFEPVRTRGTLRIEGEADRISELHGARLVNIRGSSRRAPIWQGAMLSLLGPVEWSNLDWTQAPEIAAPLVDVPDTVYRANQGKSGTYTAEVTLRAIAFEKAGAMAVRSGAGYRRSPRAAAIASVELRDDGDCVVTLREVSLSGWRTAAWRPTQGQYFLVNHTTREALFPDISSRQVVLSGDWLREGGTALWVERRVLRFKSPFASKGPVIDAAWLAQAELVRVEPVSLGVFTKPLKVDEFVLRPLR